MLAPDILHEVELGVWKALLRQLIRMVYTYGVDSIAELNSR